MVDIRTINTGSKEIHGYHIVNWGVIDGARFEHAFSNVDSASEMRKHFG